MSGVTESELVWWPQKGWGFLAPTKKFPYDESYFVHCRAQERTTVGRQLIHYRRSMLDCYRREEDLVVDVGVGGGTFCQYARVRGHDINPVALSWLKHSGLLWDEIKGLDPDILCFWDSMEHMLSPQPLIGRACRMVFISMPIYESGEEAANSKHFKPNEHLWYFTGRGLVRFMEELGFHLVERHRDEERFGREGVGSFVFEREQAHT